MSLWTEPESVLAGDPLPADFYNEQVVENLKHLHDNMPSVRVFHNTTQTTVSGVDLAVLFNTEIWKSDVLHDIAVNSSRLTIQTPGFYLCGGNIQFNTLTSLTGGYLGLLANGSTFFARQGLGNLGLEMLVVGLYEFATNEYVQLILNLTGAGKTVNSVAAYAPVFWAHKVG